MQEKLKDILYTIPSTPYADKNDRGELIGNGVSRAIYWPGGKDTIRSRRTVLSPTDPPKSHCVGFVFEYIIRVLQEFGRTDIPHHEIDAILYWTFINANELKRMGYDMDQDISWWGAPAILVAFGMADMIEDPRDAEMGDVVQKWDYLDGNRWGGHAMIALGEIGEHRGHETLLNRGSSNSRPAGVKDDWHYLDGANLSTPKERRFKIARFKKSFLVPD